MHFVESAAFRVVHISIQRNHLHLIVEALNKRELQRHGLIDPFEVPGPLG